jgi:hypothetical protein
MARRIPTTREIEIQVGTPHVRIGPRHEVAQFLKAKVDARDWVGVVDLEIGVFVDPSGRASCHTLDFTAEPPTAISGAALDSLPLARTVERVFRDSIIELEPVPGEDDAVRVSRAQAEDVARLVPGAEDAPKRGRRRTEDRIERSGTLYREAVTAGLPPTKHVARELGVSRSTARRYVALALLDDERLTAADGGRLAGKRREKHLPSRAVAGGF